MPRVRDDPRAQVQVVLPLGGIVKAFLACALLLLVGPAAAQEKKVYYFNPDWSRAK